MPSAVVRMAPRSISYAHGSPSVDYTLGNLAFVLVRFAELITETPGGLPSLYGTENSTNGDFNTSAAFHCNRVANDHRQ